MGQIPTVLVSNYSNYIKSLDLRKTLPDTDKKLQRAIIACSVMVDCLLASAAIVGLVLSGLIPAVSASALTVIVPVGLAGAAKAMQLYKEILAERAEKFNELVDALEEMAGIKRKGAKLPLQGKLLEKMGRAVSTWSWLY